MLLVPMQLLNTIFFIAQLIILFMLFVWIIRNYIQYRYKTLVFIFIAVGLMIFSHIYTIIFPFDTEIGIMAWSLITIVQLISLYLILLFIESFESENVLTKKNLILGGLMVSATPLYFMLSMLMRILIGQYNLTSIEHLFEDSVPTYLELSVSVLYVIFSILLYVLFFIIAVCIIKRLVSKIRNTRNTDVKNLLKKMTVTLGIMILAPVFIGVLFQNPNIDLAGFIITISLGLFFYFYNKGGIFLLQSESLRNLIIINESGIPVYSYSFNTFEEDNSLSKTECENKQILFSGALKAISNLIHEFVGEEKEIKEIAFEDLKLLIKPLGDKLSIVLVTDLSSKYFIEALEGFKEDVGEVIASMSTDINLRKNEVENVNALVESNFGVSKGSS